MNFREPTEKEHYAVDPLMYRFGRGLLLTLGRLGNAFGARFERPVIMVGSGRCGTTLMGQILKSHPDIAKFPSDADVLWHPALEPFEYARIDIPPIEVDPRKFTELSIANWPKNHTQAIKEIFNGFHLIAGRKRIFFVKSAMISFMIAKIVSIFPKAKFVHIYRYAPSVIESIFKKNFGKYSKYRFTEDEYYGICAKYWSDCIMEIERVRASLSLDTRGCFFELSYESVCENPEGVLRDLAAFIGIENSRFTFDFSEIRNKNYKVVGKPVEDRLMHLVGEEISPAMKLKGYL